MWLQDSWSKLVIPRQLKLSQSDFNLLTKDYVDRSWKIRNEMAVRNRDGGKLWLLALFA